MTGFALGGNKTRKVDYLFGDAVRNNANTIVTMKATGFSRNAAVAAAAWGLDLHVVVAGAESEQNSFSQALFKQCGTKLYYTPEGEGALPAAYDSLMTILRTQGRATYELHPGGSDSIGALGYVQAFQDIIDFLKALRHLFFAYHPLDKLRGYSGRACRRPMC